MTFGVGSVGEMQPQKTHQRCETRNILERLVQTFRTGIGAHCIGTGNLRLMFPEGCAQFDALIILS